ncbi:MAG: helix-turn-helix transcriptional regulator, partial [Eubacterium sp.]|nr:helix-turn-helix transcriptional regulator [Eubacterium sp.]
KLFAVSGGGLLAGRLGDAIGEMITLLLAEHVLILIAALAALFAAAVILFFVLYQRRWLSQYPGQETEQEKFSRFSAQYELSAREREVLMLILQEKNNQEIAEVLSISESTVKFHIHNLLQKTGCRNRVILLNTYTGLPR